ncbi:MAG: metallophosphoesterase [Hyphomonadaceae bacterium]|nr:metallophosphoesterase [Hyphomonadaceae bacterium]
MLLVHLTDLHFGCADEQALAAAAKYIQRAKPDAVIVSGDISTIGLQSELNAACEWMRSLGPPVVVTPGNHDVPYYNPLGRLLFCWDRYDRATTGLIKSEWHTPDFSIIPINTARGLQMRLNWAQGAISHSQIEAASRALQQAAPGALKIVVTHHPLDWPNDAPIKGVTINGARAMGQLTQAGAELFLSGHLHFASARMIQRRALSISSGTLSQRVRHEPCAYTVLRRLPANTLEVEVMHIKQGVAETASKRSFDITPSCTPGIPPQVHAAP